MDELAEIIAKTDKEEQAKELRGQESGYEQAKKSLPNLYSLKE